MCIAPWWLRLGGGCRGVGSALLWFAPPRADAAAARIKSRNKRTPPPSPPTQEPARKRAKASSRGRSLSELLPAPKNAPAGGGRKLDLLGGGKAAGGRGRAYDSDEDEIVPGTEDRSGMVELRPGGWVGRCAGYFKRASRLRLHGCRIMWVSFSHMRARLAAEKRRLLLLNPPNSCLYEWRC